MLGALSPVPRGGARLAAVCRGSRRRRALSSSSAGERWQLGTLALEVACTPCVVTAPWGAARKGAAFAPSRPAAGSAFAEACREAMRSTMRNADPGPMPAAVTEAHGLLAPTTRAQVRLQCLREVVGPCAEALLWEVGDEPLRAVAT